MSSDVERWLEQRFGADARAANASAVGPAARSSRPVRHYTLSCQVAYGGTAVVHLGMLENASGFRRPVAIKRIRCGLPKERERTSALRYEALLGCHVRHPNVVPVFDLFEEQGELLLVMEYVIGETLARLQNAGCRLPLPVVVAILSGVLRGLHASHIATDGSGEPLCIVHRDVSPQNIVVGVDGIARILDFGVAKAVSSEPTNVGYVKGKVGYFAPEQFLDDALDARTDVFGAGIVLWEAIAGRRLFEERDPVEGVLRFLSEGVEPVSKFNEQVPQALDALLARALQRSPDRRFATAEEFAEELEAVVRPASPSEVARCLSSRVGLAIELQRSLLRSMQTEEEPGIAMRTNRPLSESIRFNSHPSLSVLDDEATVVQRPRRAFREPVIFAPAEIEELTHVYRPTPTPVAFELRDSTEIDEHTEPSEPPLSDEWNESSEPTEPEDSPEPTEPTEPDFAPEAASEPEPEALRLPRGLAKRIGVGVLAAGIGLCVGLGVAFLIGPSVRPSGPVASLEPVLAAPEPPAPQPLAAAAAAPAEPALTAPAALADRFLLGAESAELGAADPERGSARPGAEGASAPATAKKRSRAGKVRVRVKPPAVRLAPNPWAPSRSAASAKAVESVKPPASAKAVESVKPPASAKPAVGAGAAACDPPYRIDIAGIKRMKVECL